MYNATNVQYNAPRRDEEVPQSDFAISRNIRFAVFYLFIACVFIQVWVIVATSNSPPTIIITAVLSVLAVAIIVWRQVFGRPTATTTPSEPTRNVALTTPSVTTRTTANVGLDPSITSTLYKYKYKPTNTTTSEGDNILQTSASTLNEDGRFLAHDLSCIICLNDYIAGDDMIRLTPCHHVYHEKCVLEWFIGHKNCPLCKQDVTASIDTDINIKAEEMV